MELPGTFCEKVLRTWGTSGEAWLKKLPEVQAEFIAKWQLTGCRVAENLSYNFICFARSKRYGDVVLKIGFPHIELYSGMEALGLYGGKHACALYEADRAKGAMLLERIIPGARLKDEPDFAKRISVGQDMVKKLPLEIGGGHDFPTFEGQMERAFERARRENRAGKEFLGMLNLAECFYWELQLLNRPRVLLHGDLHHENILMGASGWRAIDPQGRIGEQCLEAGRFLINEWSWFGGGGDLRHMAVCLDAFAKALGESRATIAAACFLDYTVSRCWSLEDGEGLEAIQDALHPMKNLLEFINHA